MYGSVDAWAKSRADCASIQIVQQAILPTLLALSSCPQPRQQLRRRPAVGRHSGLDLHVADGDAGLQAEYAVDAADVIAARLQELLHLALLLEGDLRTLLPLVDRRRAVDAIGEIGAVSE